VISEKKQLYPDVAVNPATEIPRPTKIIRPPSLVFLPQIAELWRFRELLFFLIWRDIKVTYKQTILGVTWVLLQPILTTVILIVIFERIAKLPSDNIPYAVVVLSGLVPWSLFSNAISRAGTSLVSNQALVSKVYFPRIITPLAAVLSGFVDFLISLVLLFGLMLFSSVPLSPYFPFLVVFTLQAIALSAGIGFWLSALNVRYRDVKYVIPFFVQFGTYITPVGYLLSVVQNAAIAGGTGGSNGLTWQVIAYTLNPMVGIIEGYRWSLIGGYALSDGVIVSIIISVIITLLVFFSGWVYFENAQRAFADII
jgi:lipopolysaccharide transport system permease protein